MVMMDDKALFVDTNILINANIIETPFHEQALFSINTAYQADRTIWISRQIIREYLAVLTRPQTFENLPRTTVLEQAIDFTERFEVAVDTPAVTTHLLQLLADFDIGGKQVHDANIVATMMANDIHCLLTRNVKDFQRFEALIKIEQIDS